MARLRAFTRTAPGSPPGKVDLNSKPEDVLSDCPQQSSGFTLVELTVSMVIFSLVAISFFALFSSLISSTIVSKRQAVASSLATGQMEYLKSLPYDSLAVSGGAIYSANPLPASSTKTLNGVTYTIITSINYIDDAYDGCGPYPSQEVKELYCRSYPPPGGSPTTDLNPQDYKIVHVTVNDKHGLKLAEVDTQISSRVSETDSATGALFVTVIDQNGNKLPNAGVTVTNSHLSPNINLSDSTDSNGIAIFYGLPPDTNGHYYQVLASKSGYSSLSTIPPFGSLQPTYSNQNIFAQQSSYVTLMLKQMGVHSLIIETVDTNGSPLSNVKLYIKGGYKKYIETSNTDYYYDNLTPTDDRLTTDANGFAVLDNLAPGAYIFCGDNGSVSCAKLNTQYYADAALPYGGDNPFNPIAVPIYNPLNPPATTFDFNGTEYLQKVRIMMSSDNNFPRVITLEPSNVSLASSAISTFAFNITGSQLPCGSSPASCNTVVSFKQGSNTFTAGCSGQSGGDQLNCEVDLTGAVEGIMQTVVSVSGRTLQTPVSLPIGGLIVNP